MIPAEQRRTALARQVGSLALSHATAHRPLLLRAIGWHNRLSRLGIHLPLFLTHDLGLLLTTPASSGATIGPRPLLRELALGADPLLLLQQYQQLLELLASSEVIERAATWRMRDELVVVLLARVLGDSFQRWPDPAKAVGQGELPPDPLLYQDLDLLQHFRDFDPAPFWDLLRFLFAHQMQIYTSLEQIDLDTLRLLGALSPTSNSPGSGLDLVDFYNAFRHTDTQDIVDFSLELLPSVLETKRALGVQTFAVDGYASIERRGAIDSLLLTEFAHEEELFEHRVAQNELFYYGREKEPDPQRRLQYLLIDSSSSMRGVRQVFGRGLALALSKKLLLGGNEVWLRFFDSRLHELQAVTAADAVAPYLLSFRSERGRNYGRVFHQFASELSRLRTEEHRQVVVYLITHGECHLPTELVEQMARDAFLRGIFILPSSPLTLDYLGALDRYQVVDRAALASRQERRDRALSILREAGD